MAEMFKMTPGGNIQMIVNLTPEAYAALKTMEDRDHLRPADAVSVALMTLAALSEKMNAAGKPLSAAIEENDAAAEG